MTMFDGSMYDEDENTVLVMKRIHVTLEPKHPKVVTRLQRGDKLFITNKGGPHISYLSPVYIDQAYIQGYQDAADMLVALMIEDSSYLDSFAYPVIFLYRQCIELSLKELIREGNKILDRPREGNLGFPTIHKLDLLWSKCEGILKDPRLGIADQETSEEMEVMGELIEEFKAVDPQSMTFRYPANSPDWEKVDVPHFKEIAGKMACFFSSVGDYIDVIANAV
jgi:hypothetical protein